MIKKFQNDLSDFAVNTMLVPITFLVLITMLFSLVFFAFNKESDWGLFSKTLVGIGVPTFIFFMITNNRFSNTFFILFYCLLWGSLAISFFGFIAYVCFKDVLKAFI